nr:hypothetical protein [Tanacetum cinerariifolium]
MVPVAVLTQSKPVPITAVRPVSTVVLKPRVTRPRNVKPIITKFNSPNRRYITRSPSLKTSNSLPIVIVVKASVVSAAQEGRYIDSLKKTMNYQPVTAGNQSNPSTGFQDKFDAEKAGKKCDQQYVLFPMWSSGSKNPHNTDRDAVFDGKEPEFDEKKPESEVNVSPSSSAQSKKQDDKTKREAKGKSLIESFTGYRYLSAHFEDYSEDSINEVNATGTLVPTIMQISPNSTNTFSAAGPLNAASSPTHRKSSCIDASQLPDDPDMLKLEDITYSDDEDDVVQRLTSTI